MSRRDFFKIGETQPTIIIKKGRSYVVSKPVEVKQADEKQYDGSEMDEIKSPPLKMIGAFFIITVIGFLYTFTWSFVMNL